jgi:nucleoside-diphosphate-sugar epimerase
VVRRKASLVTEIKRMNDLRGTRVLVTGAAGFIGANLVRTLLDRGASVHGLVRSSTKLWRLQEILTRFTLHRTDLVHGEALRDVVKRIQPEIIFHLAVSRADSSPEERLTTLQTNIVGTFNLLEAAASLNHQRFVLLGSSMEYGLSGLPLRESEYPSPTTLFGATKASATLLCQQVARARQSPIMILRLFMVYGYWESPARLIPASIMAALNNREIALTRSGYRRDWVFVEDVVQACVLAAGAANPAGEIINIGCGEQWSNEEIVTTIESIVGQPLRVRVGAYPARPWDRDCWVADNQKAKQWLGWEPRHSLRSGLEKTVSWFRLHQAYGRRS